MLPTEPARSEALTRLLLATSAVALTLVVVFAGLWLVERASPPVVEELSTEQRQGLVEELIRHSPGIYQAAWFAPRLGYTLRPGEELTAWGHTFRANELGYRSSGPTRKRRNVYRVLFVGDSWTFGMGVAEEETFARRFEELANRYAGIERRVESWILALPGYNTFNELTALELFRDRLRPDLVVLAPTTNDVDGANGVLPNGSLTHFGTTRDAWGAERPVAYNVQAVDSFEFRGRWRRGMSAVRETAERLEADEVPLFLFFTGTWREIFAHRLMSDSRIGAPYAITPVRLTTPEWRNPLPVGHATAAANALYARVVYAGIASILGWPSLPGPEVQALQPEELVIHQEPPPRRYVVRRSELFLADVTKRSIPERFAPGEEPARRQCVGVIDPATGSLGPGGAILVRRTAAPELRVTVGLEPGVPALYPLQLTVSIPAKGGGSRTVREIPGTDSARSFAVDVPESIPVGSAIDVVFTVDNVGLGRSGWLPRSLRIIAVEPAT